jgi:hypothetical protein
MPLHGLNLSLTDPKGGRSSRTFAAPEVPAVRCSGACRNKVLRVAVTEAHRKRGCNSFATLAVSLGPPARSIRHMTFHGRRCSEDGLAGLGGPSAMSRSAWKPRS